MHLVSLKIEKKGRLKVGKDIQFNFTLFVYFAWQTVSNLISHYCHAFMFAATEYQVKLSKLLNSALRADVLQNNGSNQRSVQHFGIPM